MIRPLIFIVLGLVVLFAPADKLASLVPDAINPLSPLAREINSVVGDRSKENLTQLAANLEAAANLFEQDKNRPVPYYGNEEKLKWATRRINELSYPDGYKMDDVYPGLKNVLGNYLETKLGNSYSHDSIIREFKELAKAIREVAP